VPASRKLEVFAFSSMSLSCALAPAAIFKMRCSDRSPPTKASRPPTFREPLLQSFPPLLEPDEALRRLSEDNLLRVTARTIPSSLQIVSRSNGQISMGSARRSRSSSRLPDVTFLSDRMPTCTPLPVYRFSSRITLDHRADCTDPAWHRRRTSIETVPPTYTSESDLGDSWLVAAWLHPG
jgi:hypothetical protein